MTCYGPDGSIWQNGIKLTAADWDAIDFVIWRCVREDGTPDPSYPWARDQAIAHRKPFATYVFLSGNPVRQAEAAAAVIGDKTVPVMADWEKPGYTPASMFAWVGRMRTLGFTVPLLYTGMAFWQSSGKPTLTDYGLELVVARYGDQQPTATYEIRPRYAQMDHKYGAVTWAFNIGGLRPVIWQYGSRIRWGDRPMDMNAFRGTPAELARWFKMPPAAHPVPPKPSAPATTKPPAPSPPGEDDVKLYAVQAPDRNWYVTDMATFKTYIESPQVFNEGKFFGWIPGVDGGIIVLSAAWDGFMESLPTTAAG